MELTRYTPENTTMISKHKEFVNSLQAAGVGSPRSLFKEVNAYRNNLEGSSSGPWKHQEISFNPKSAEVMAPFSQGVSFP